MRSRDACRLGFALTIVLIEGCKPHITLGELRKKNEATFKTADSAFLAMAKTVSATKPVLNGECRKPGLAPAPSYGPGDYPDPGPDKDTTTEIVDGAYLATQNIQDAIAKSSYVFRAQGPVLRVVSETRYDESDPNIKMDPVQSQRPYDAANKVRYVLVVNAPRDSSQKAPEHADVYLFGYPKADLVCSFAVDVAADRNFARDNGYDPKTGDFVTITYAPEQQTDLYGALAQSLSDRFGLDLPREPGNIGPAPVKRASDDPRVVDRATAVSKALDAAPEKLPECAAGAAKTDVRVNKRDLRILAKLPLLTEWRKVVLNGAETRDPDSNVDLDPSGSPAVVTYLHTRDKPSADKLATAASWGVVDVQTGGRASSIDNQSFSGGFATGRLVVFDPKNVATCQVAFSIPAPASFDAKVTHYQGSSFDENNLGAISRAYLKKQIDDKLGAP